MTESFVQYALYALFFPGVVAGGLTIFIREMGRRHLVRLRSTTPVESDFRNEGLDPSFDRLSTVLMFAILFNLLYLIIGLGQLPVSEANLLGFSLLGILCFMVAASLAFSFSFRFFTGRYVTLGISLAVVGSIAMTAAVQLGYAAAKVAGTSTAMVTGALLVGKTAGYPDAFLLPATIAATAWAISFAAFFADRRQRTLNLPLRIPDARAYRLFLAALVVGWAGVITIALHTLLSI